MLIHLTNSKLFTHNPADRFAETYDIDPFWWYELWTRYVQLAYTVPELCEWMYVSTKVKIPRKTMYRWITRNEIYIRALSARKKGAKVVTTEFFTPFEEDVIREITKNLRNGTAKSSRIIV